jgi:hypothetical protein
MPLTYQQAADEMYGLLKAAWDAGAAALNDGALPLIRWPYQFEDKKAPVTDVWARVSRQTVREGQSSFRNGEFGRTYTSDGLLFVQIFAPLNDAAAGRKLQSLAVLARDTFRGQTTAGGIWFRNGRIQEIPNDAKSYQIKVVTEYQYDEIGG